MVARRLAAAGTALLLMAADPPPAPNSESPTPSAASPTAGNPASQAAPPASGAAPAAVQQMPTEAAIAVLGHTVDGQDGKDIARIVDVLVDGAGQPVAAVVDFGGFLGVGSRKIAVNWKNLKFSPADKDHPITLNMTSDQIGSAPAYKEQQSVPVVTAPAAATLAAPPAHASATAPADTAPPAGTQSNPPAPAPKQ